MSTKTTDTNTIQYDPGSKGVYSSLQSPIGNTLSQFMQNPLTSSFFNQRVGMGQNQISKMGASGMQSLLSNNRNMGGGGSNPFLQSQIARQGRATSGLMSNNFLNQLMQANQLQLGATGMAQSYNPLMTGSTGTQTKSGLGTWLPQLIGSLGGAAIGAFTGGASSATGAGGTGAGSAFTVNGLSNPSGAGIFPASNPLNPFAMGNFSALGPG